MILFWIVCAIATATAAVLIMRRAVAAGGAADAPSPELETHRRALSELDELRARGLLDDGGWSAARAEAGRRLLKAAEVEREPLRPDSLADRRLLLIAVALFAPLALGLYLVAGSPSLGDQPYARRLAEWRAADPATLEPAAQVALLEVAVRERPRDVEAWRYLGQARAEIDDPFGAARALQTAVSLAPNDARLWTLLGGALVDLSGGEVGPDARQAFERALRLDPSLEVARAFLDGRQGEVAAAEAEQQSQMIRGMVEGLAARLEAAPDDPQGWARLIRSYEVLGDTTARDAALARARKLFGSRPQDLALVESAAQAPR